MAISYETEWELELESGLHEGEEETGLEGEGMLGAIGNALGGLLGEEEQHELAHELGAHEHHEHAHEFEDELAHEFEHHELAHEFEQHEFEGGEQFFGRIARRIGRFVRRAAPLLARIARVAAPIVGTAIGGPVGGFLGKAAGSVLGEGELEQHELAHEFEHHELAHEFEQHEYEQHELEQHEFEQHEFETHESSQEIAHEIVHHEVTHHEALAEMMAQAAAHEQHEGEAEAMVGAAVMTVISPADRRALRRILPHLVRGVAILTRMLRRRRITRPAVRAVPTIVRRTVQVLKQQASAGKPVTRRTAGRVAATQVKRVLGSPTVCAAAIAQNVRASRAVTRPRRLSSTAG
jgi:hypothetical protein